MGKNVLFGEAWKYWQVTDKSFVVEMWVRATHAEEIVSAEHHEFAWEVCAKSISDWRGIYFCIAVFL